MLIFTARRYASAVLAVVLCPSIRPSVCPSVRHTPVLYQNGTVSCKQRHRIAQGLLFFDAREIREIRTGLPQTGATNANGVGYNGRILTNITRKWYRIDV